MYLDPGRSHYRFAIFRNHDEVDLQLVTNEKKTDETSCLNCTATNQVVRCPNIQFTFSW